MNSGIDEIQDCNIAPNCKSQLSSEQCYSSLEHETLEILHGLEKFHHFYFVREVCIITDHKPLVAILINDVAVLSQ